MKFYLTDEEKRKIKNLGILKTSQAAYFLNVDRKTIIRLIKKGLLKAKRSKTYKKGMFLIKGDNLIKFVEEFLEG